MFTNVYETLRSGAVTTLITVRYQGNKNIFTKGKNMKQWYPTFIVDNSECIIMDCSSKPSLVAQDCVLAAKIGELDPHVQAVQDGAYVPLYQVDNTLKVFDRVDRVGLMIPPDILPPVQAQDADTLVDLDGLSLVELISEEQEEQEKTGI
jgi:hypothetical protein